MFTKIKDIFSKDPKMVIWDRDYSSDKENREMIYRIPNKEIEDFHSINYIGVRDYERAIYYNSGRTGGTLGGGQYQIEKEAKNSATEVIWFDPGLIPLTWGIGWQTGIPARTSDGFALGASGKLMIQIDDPEALITQVITGKPEFTDADMKELIRTTIITSFRDVVGTYSLEGFLTSDRDTVNQRMQTAASSELLTYGLKLNSAHILGVTHPPEDERQVKQITERKKEMTGIKATSERDQVNNLLSDIRAKEEQLRKLKSSLDELEMKYAMSEVTKYEYDEKSKRIKEFITNRENEINELREKVNSM